MFSAIHNADAVRLIRNTTAQAEAEGNAPQHAGAAKPNIIEAHTLGALLPLSRVSPPWLQWNTYVAYAPGQ